MTGLTTVIYGGGVADVLKCLETITDVSKKIVVANSFAGWQPSILGSIERVFLVGDEILSASDIADLYDASELICLP